jgi:hypothetical protein
MMKRIRKWWLPLLLGALLTALLMGAAAARPRQQAQAAVTKKLTISMAEFSPIYDSAYIPSPHEKYGDYLHSRLDESPIELVAPVQFPHDGQVTVEKLELIAWDQNPDFRATLQLFRTNPSKLESRTEMAAISTGDSWAGGYHAWTEPDVTPRRVTTSHQAWLLLWLFDDTDLSVFGVRIYYHEGK